MHKINPTRRAMLAGLAGAAAFPTLGRSQPARPAAPATPLTLNIIDVAGNLQLTQRSFEEYRRANPALVGKFTFTQAPAPELPGKLKAQQAAGRVDIDVVLTGTDGIAAGLSQNLWEKLLPEHSADLPDLAQLLLPAAVKMQALTQGQGICICYSPGGPLLEYMPARVAQPPKSAAELLDWSRAHPKRFMYARPANSGPGRAFLMGLPYLLGDSDPKDPVKGWDKTWAYLSELGRNVEYYPTGTGATMKELGEGSRDIIATMTGWDINPRVLGVVPKEAEIIVLKDFHWVTDAHYMAIPRGLAPEKLPILLDLIRYMLTPKAQAVTYDKGYFYPGPSVKGVTLDMAPPDSQEAIREYTRPFYDQLIAERPAETPLDADKMVLAFARWDEQIGAKVGK